MRLVLFSGAPDALTLQSVPEDEELWKLENFETFLEARRRMLAAELNRFLESIEDVIVKSIAAFANRNGGTFLVGVRDDGEIAGLEHDFLSLNAAGSERLGKIELHLRNILNHHFGVTYVTTKIRIEFPMVDDNEICRLTVQASTRPVFVQLADKTAIQLSGSLFEAEIHHKN